eukprot:987593-Pelagomonas_calceolata.AAC.1
MALPLSHAPAWPWPPWQRKAPARAEAKSTALKPRPSMPLTTLAEDQGEDGPATAALQAQQQGRTQPAGKDNNGSSSSTTSSSSSTTSNSTDAGSVGTGEKRDGSRSERGEEEGVMGGGADGAGCDG